MKTQQVIEALKASVGSYFWEKFITGQVYDGDEGNLGHVSFKWFGKNEFLTVREGRCLTPFRTEFTLEEAKTILGTYAVAWERAHPEGALVQPLPFPFPSILPFPSRDYCLKYAGVAFYISPPDKDEEDQSYLMGYSPYEFKGESLSSFDSFEEAEKAGRQAIHDHLKSQLKP